MTNKELANIAEQFGTPVYVFDVDALVQRIQRIRSLWSKEIGLCYSIKANPFLIQQILPEVDHVEVCSPGELSICEHCDVDADKVVYSGVCKQETDISEAIRYRAGIYTAESISQAKLVNDIAEKMGVVVPILLRLNAGSQFGMSEKDLWDIIDHRDLFPNLRIEGIHYFAGTQRASKDFKRQAKDFEVLRNLFQRATEEHSFTFEKLEYGPGLPVPLFCGDNFEDTFAPARAIAPMLKDALNWCGSITVEMGRFFTTDCGYLLTRVMDEKTCGQMHYAIVDSGIHHLTYYGQIMGMKIPVFQVLTGAEKMNALSDEATEYTICGSLCTTNDVLIRSVKLHRLQVGDVIAFENLGAYAVTEGISLFLSRDLPGVILFSEKAGACPVRQISPTWPINVKRILDNEVVIR